MELEVLDQVEAAVERAAGRAAVGGGRARAEWEPHSGPRALRGLRWHGAGAAIGTVDRLCGLGSGRQERLHPGGRLQLRPHH